MQQAYGIITPFACRSDKTLADNVEGRELTSNERDYEERGEKNLKAIDNALGGCWTGVVRSVLLVVPIR
jgi:hypothetical protein